MGRPRDSPSQPYRGLDVCLPARPRVSGGPSPPAGGGFCPAEPTRVSTSSELSLRVRAASGVSRPSGNSALASQRAGRGCKFFMLGKEKKKHLPVASSCCLDARVRGPWAGCGAKAALAGGDLAERSGDVSERRENIPALDDGRFPLKVTFCPVLFGDDRGRCSGLSPGFARTRETESGARVHACVSGTRASAVSPRCPVSLLGKSLSPAPGESPEEGTRPEGHVCPSVEGEVAGGRKWGNWGGARERPGVAHCPRRPRPRQEATARSQG